jgi:hypothetical protein
MVLLPLIAVEIGAKRVNPGLPPPSHFQLHLLFDGQVSVFRVRVRQVCANLSATRLATSAAVCSGGADPNIANIPPTMMPRRWAACLKCSTRPSVSGY